MYWTGDEPWPPACSLKYVGGEQFGHHDRVMVDALQPGEMTDVSIEMGSPSSTGIFQGQWRMNSPTGLYFGGAAPTHNQCVFGFCFCLNI